MKKLLLAICGGALLWTGCKEYDTPIDFNTAAVSDTTYVVTPVPTALPHNVLVEEFTGQSCPNCPAAHADLDVISASNPGRINVVSMYTYGQPQANPPSGAKYDFQDSTATNISNIVYNGIPGLPAAGIDRTPSGGTLLQVGYNSWNNIINTQLNAIDSLNLSVTSSYDSATKAATITAIVTYTQAVSTPQNLSIVIVEDSMVDIQEDNTAPSGFDNSFLFLDVFRGMVTSEPWGDALQVTSGNNAKVQGQLFQKVYNYTLPVKSPAIVPAHCRVIAFVDNQNGTDIHVMQSAQCPLMQ